jgi:hypothetical protein
VRGHEQERTERTVPIRVGTLRAAGGVVVWDTLEDA